MRILFKQRKTDDYSFSGRMWESTKHMATNQREFSFNSPEHCWDCNTIMSNDVHSKPGNVCNAIVLLIKQLMYSKKCLGMNLSIMEIMYEITMQKQIEFENCTSDQMKDKWYNKWGPVLHVFRVKCFEQCTNFSILRARTRIISIVPGTTMLCYNRK